LKAAPENTLAKALAGLRSWASLSDDVGMTEVVEREGFYKQGTNREKNVGG